MFKVSYSDSVRYAAIFAAVTCATYLESARGEEQAEAARPIALRVLYAGNPESDRAADFEKLLKEHVAAVEIADYRKFEPAHADDFDVVIFDWSSTYPRDEDGKINWGKEHRFSPPQPPKLTREFRRPAVLIGAAGGGLTHSLDIAINWK